MKKRRFFPIGTMQAAFTGWLTSLSLGVIIVVSELFTIAAFDGISDGDNAANPPVANFVFSFGFITLLLWLSVERSVLQWFDRVESDHGIKSLRSYVMTTAIVFSTFVGAASGVLTLMKFAAGMIELTFVLAFSFGVAGAFAGIVAFYVRRRFVQKQETEVADVFAP